MNSTKQGVILAIDEGTTSTRVLGFDSVDQSITHIEQQEISLFHPNPGWVEQDANEIWQKTKENLDNTITHYHGSHQQHDPNSIDLDHMHANTPILGIAITNQRETIVAWDKETGQPLAPAIVWQDRRTSDMCNNYERALLDQPFDFSEKTGLVMDAYFSMSKMVWLLKNNKKVQKAAQQKNLCFGTIDAFLIWKLTDGKQFKTDATNACRTGLCNLLGQWDHDLLNFFGIEQEMLPEIMPNHGDFGHYIYAGHNNTLPLPIIASIGDQQSALVGQGCGREGMTKSTYGTGCFMLTNIGDNKNKRIPNLLTTIAYHIDGKCTYALEGSIFTAGQALHYLKNQLILFNNYNEMNDLVENKDQNRHTPPQTANDIMRDEPVFIPSFTGLGAPYWTPEASASIMGLRASMGRASIAKAALSASSYHTLDLITLMREYDIQPSVMRADGGMIHSDFAMQRLADMIGIDVECPEHGEMTALGAACIGLYHLGYINTPFISATQKANKSFSPMMSSRDAEALYTRWKNAIAATIGFAEN